MVLVFTKSGDETWPTVAEAFSLDDAVVDTEAPTDEEPDEEVRAADKPRRRAAAAASSGDSNERGAEFQNTLLYNIDWMAILSNEQC